MRSLAALILLMPGAALAQQKPIITLSNIPNQFRLLNTEDVEGDAPIELSWQADVTGFQTYRYEITYDAPTDLETGIEGVLIVLDDTPDAGENMGVVTSGAVYRIRIRPSQILKPEDLPQNNPPVDLDDDPQQRSIVVQVFIPGQEGDDITANSMSWTFDYDTRPPPAPTLTDLFPGENHLSVEWAPPDQDADVNQWEVVYCPDATGAVVTETSTSGDEIEALPCAESEQKTRIAGLAPTTTDIDEGIRNDVPVAVAVRAIDDVGNRGALSNARVQTPAETTDFWELYQGLGGQEDGGFCFIATAAEGSYAHPVVRVLRAFRDRVLKSSYAGTGLVWIYYRWSPPAAEALRHDAHAAGWARIALLPISILALIWTLLPFFGAAAVAVLLFRRLRSKPILLAFVLMMPGIARADEVRLTRPAATGLVGFGIEFKGGPYLPDMAKDTSTAGNEAFNRVFGTGTNPLFRLGVDVQLFRAFGTAGVGGNFGFMQWVGKGVFGISDNQSRDTTVFNILPVTLEVFYRFDWLADHAPVPLVPYVRGGLAYDFWWITNSNGHVSRFKGNPDDDSDDLPGRGGKFGVTGTAGLALMLNFIEPTSAQSLYNSTGIRGTYLFGEVTGAKVDGFGKDGFDFSEVTWYAGMYVEF